MRSNLPSHWKKTNVGSLIDRHFSGLSPDCEERQISDLDEWGVLKTTAITWGGWNESAHKVLPRRYWGLKRIAVKKGDVLVTKAGPRERVAVVVHVTTEPRNLVVSGKMVALRPKREEVLPRILSAALAQPQPQKFLQDRTTGMAESQVNFANEVLLQTPICIPPLAHQEVLADLLETVDAAIKQTEALIAKYQRIKTGLMQDLLTRGIDEHGRLRDPATHKFKPSPLGHIPTAWQVVRLSDFCPPGSPITYGVLKPGVYASNGIPLLQIEDVIHGDIDADAVHRISRSLDAQYARTRLKGGEVVVSLVGTIGKVAQIPVHLSGANLHRNLARIEVAPPNSSEYLYHVLQSQNVQKAIKDTTFGSTQSLLNLGALRSLLVPRPEPSEQGSLASILNAQDAILRTESESLFKLIRLKAGLMQDLLTGEVPVDRLLETQTHN